MMCKKAQLAAQFVKCAKKLQLDLKNVQHGIPK